MKKMEKKNPILEDIRKSKNPEQTKEEYIFLLNEATKAKFKSLEHLKGNNYYLEIARRYYSGTW